MGTNSALTEESKRVVTAMYDAGIRGDFAGVMSQMDENLVVYEPPFLPYGGTYKGLANFPKIIESLSVYGDLTKINVKYMVAEGEHVFCVMEIPDIKSGKNFLIAEESIVRNGKIVEMRPFYFDAGTMIGTKK